MGRDARAWARLALLVALLACLGPARAEPVLSIRVVGDGGRSIRLYPDHLSALRAAPEGQAQWVSADMVLAKSRAIVDGVYAGIDLQVEAGAEKLGFGRHAFCQKLLEALLKRTDVTSADTKNRAIAYVAAAVIAAGAKGINLGSSVGAMVDDLDGAYRGDPVRSFVLGYYAWSPQLTEVYSETRLLQTPLLMTDQQAPPSRFRKCMGASAEEQFAVAKLISETIRQDKTLLEHYRKLNAIYSLMWGRRVALGPLDLDEATDVPTLRNMNDYDMMENRAADGIVEWRLVPYEFSRLQGPLARAYAVSDSGSSPVTVEQYVELIQNGIATLAPPQGGGVPERELFALEPMLVRSHSDEGAVIEASASYRARLKSLFGGSPSTEREAKPKQRLPRNAPSVQLPALEPLPTVYLREARAVSTLRRGLEKALSASSCQQIFGRREDGGKPGGAVGPELKALEDLLLGCYALSAAGIGLDAAGSGELKDLAAEEKVTYGLEQLQALRTKAEAWINTRADDADSQRDVRTLTPVVRRLDERLQCWACLGVGLLEYQLSPGDSAAGERPVHLWGTVEYYAESPRKPPLPGVAEFRAELDKSSEGSRARRLIGASAGPSCLGLLLKGGCPAALVLTLVAFLLVVGMRLRTGPRYAVRKGPRQHRMVRRRMD